MSNALMPKQVLEQELSHLRRQRILIYREEQRLQEMLDNFDVEPPEPSDGTVLRSYIPSLGGSCTFVRQGKTWYGFFNDHHSPQQYTWESLCAFLHTTCHRGLQVMTAPPDGPDSTVLIGNMI